jgi:two-component system cell cycle sensor histidine kinase/response regulator CckA
LATVYGIVKQSGGRIEVYSEVGTGSTFKIYLPFAKEETRARKSLAGQVVIGRGTETVLLAEDEEGVRTLAKLVLERNGYKVLEARHGAEALLICQQYQGTIHIMVTDVVMPNMGGRQLADRLSALRPGIRLLFLSGYTDEAIVHHGVLDADTPFLQKPFAPDALALKVREVLDEPN